MSDDHSDHLSTEIERILTEGTTVPIPYQQLERAAEQILRPKVFDFIAGGAGSESTVRANRNAFQRWDILPRVLRDVSNREVHTELYGEELAAPLLLAPIGVQSIVSDKGEIASARAAAAAGVPFVLSSASSKSIEDVADSAANAHLWFQLYWCKNRDVIASLVNRAEDAGYKAIVITVDTQVQPWRERNLSHEWSPLTETNLANYVTDPVVQSEFNIDIKSNEPQEFEQISWRTDESMTWDDLAFLEERTSLPILLKGILHPSDAKKAVEYGMDGIVISTHGGRNVDGTIGALDALSSIDETVDEQITVLFDSGIRTGSDVFKAIAIGADAVLLGRPYIYGLSIAGEAGVSEIVDQFIAELHSILGMTGCKSISNIDSAYVQRSHDR